LHYLILGEQIPGGAAEYVVVPSSNLVRIPDDWDYPTAAAPLLVSVTAWRMLVHRARIRPGESVLIVGAGGGVNSISLQIAKLVGATVYALTSTEEKMARAADLGADVVLNYRQDCDWHKTLAQMTDRRGVDVVIDNVGQATLNKSIRALARGGRLLIVGNTSGPKVEIDIRQIFGKQISLIGSTMGSPQDFRDVMRLVWAGKIKAPLDRVLSLREGREGHALLESGDKFGKVVLMP
jgi:2-desacetyl-2-hydroxyethyl bacteriochlorophyllide A dehydrogenase